MTWSLFVGVFFLLLFVGLVLIVYKATKLILVRLNDYKTRFQPLCESLNYGYFCCRDFQ